MAKGKGKGRKNNKKKKNGGATAKAVNLTANNNASSNSFSSTLLKGEIPDFGDCRKSISRKNYQTLYSRYKSATSRFLDYMHKHAPEDITAAGVDSGDGGDRSINFLLSAADWMSETSHVLDPIILKDLKLCIRIRNRVAQSMFSGGDAGHEYFLKVLVYCWTMLRLLPKDEKSHVAESEPESYDENRYCALGRENEEDEEEDEEIFPASVPRPESVEKPVTLEELMSSEDRSDAILFLFTLNELMSMIAMQYQVLVRNIQKDRRQGISDTAMIENLLEGAVTSNFAIQQVQQLEMELQTQHEHLTTPCRLLSTVFMPEVTAKADSILRNHASKKCEKCDIISFVGDCVECLFLNRSDGWNRRDNIVPDFCSQYGVDVTGSNEFEQLFTQIEDIILLEVPLKPEINGWLNRMRARLSVKSHSWFSQMDFIGGDHAIHHTLRLLSGFAGVIDTCPKNKKMYLDPRRAGMFGQSPWLTGRSEKLRDMDELVMATLLPNWITMCRQGIVGQMRFPLESELCPLLIQLRSYAENPRKPVTWSLAFGVHSALTAILEVDRELYEIIKVSKSVFGAYFGQITNTVKLSMKEKTSDMKNSSVWKHNLCMVSFLENFGIAAYDERAIWNPLFSGTIFSILSFFSNLEAGCTVIDCQAQLRIVLYLFHGLLINGIIQNGQIPLLDILYDVFKECKGIWQGALPQKGDLVQRFWICFGMGLKESRHMAEKAQLFARGGILPSDIFAEGANLCQGRKMNPIEPAQLATSFRRICERDFSDVCDKYHTPEQRRNSQGSEQYMFAVRTNDTLDHIENEVMLHSTNLVSVAYYLEQFVCSLGRVLEWEQSLLSFKQMSKLGPRQGFAILFAQHLLGALDFAQDPLTHEFQNVSMGHTPSLFMVEYFKRIPTQNVLWFQGVPPSADQEVVTKY